MDCSLFALAFPLALNTGGQPFYEQAAATSSLSQRLEASPTLPFHPVPFPAQPPSATDQQAAASWVAIAHDGSVYELRRVEQGDPVMVFDPGGHLLRSWGRGEGELPHSLRIDPRGDVWTVDAQTSQVIKHSPSGRVLLTIRVGGQPENGSPFHGATDIAFARNGDILISDGYGNARVVEYSALGRRIRQWGQAGDGPGELHLPHALQIAPDGTVYVADRENGRIEVFDPAGRYLRDIPNLGRIYSLRLTRDAIWASVASFDQPPGSGDGWVLKLDRTSGAILGHLNVAGPRAGHALDLTPAGEPFITQGDHLVWFKAD